MSKWLVLAFASQSEFASFLASPGSLRFTQVKAVEDVGALMDTIGSRPAMPIPDAPVSATRPHARRTGQHITISSLVHKALADAPPTPFKANMFAKVVLGNAGLRCSSRNMKNVYHLLAKEALAGNLKRVKRGLYNKQTRVAPGPGIVSVKKRSASATSKK